MSTVKNENESGHRLHVMCFSHFHTRDKRRENEEIIGGVFMNEMCENTQTSNQSRICITTKD